MTSETKSNIGLTLFVCGVVIAMVIPIAMVLDNATDEATPEYIEMNVSAYCICEKCCGKRPDNPLYGITASGVDVKGFYGLCIAAPPEYPFGTVMEVPGYGIATVADRGGAIKGNKLDILFRTHQEALNWGQRTLIVKVERPVE